MTKTSENEPLNSHKNIAGTKSHPASVDDLFQGDITIRTLLESLAESVVIIDPTSLIQMVNSRAERLFGYRKEELIGRRLDTLIPARFHAEHQHHVAGYFAKPRIRPMGEGRNLVGRKKNGKEFPVEISLSHIETSGQRMSIAFITDITLRKAAEDALKSSNEELDAFAHTVAHDLKGSLTGIIGHSELLCQPEVTLAAQDIQESLQHISNSGHKMARIIDELLLLARLSKEEVETTSLETSSIVQEAILRLEHSCEERRAEILISGDFPPALGHAPWVEEVWYNYISNALQHGGTPPQIKIGGELKANGMAEFWVQDNGPGLTAEDRDGLFTPHARTGNKPGSHGLGLSIVKRIVEKLDGEVGVQSDPGAGCRFCFSLPVPEE